MTKYFKKTAEMGGLSYIKIPLKSSANLNIQADDKYCSIWSILAHLHPKNNNHPNRVSNYRQYFYELNIQGCDFTNGFKSSDVHKFEKLNILSINKFELNSYQDQNKWKHKLIPMEVSKNESDREIDLINYKKHYVLVKKLQICLGNHNCIFVWRRCLNSFTSQSVLVKDKQQCGEKDIIAF